MTTQNNSDRLPIAITFTPDEQDMLISVFTRIIQLESDCPIDSIDITYLSDSFAFRLLFNKFSYLIPNTGDLGRSPAFQSPVEVGQGGN